MSRTPKSPGMSERPASGRPVVAVTAGVIEATQPLLRCGLWQPTERIVYWAGVKRADVWVATTVLQPEATLTRGSFRTSAIANARVIAYLSDHGLALIGQVHSHPGSFVDHSDGDDADAFMPSDNGLSIVVPNYGRDGMLPLSQCGVHRFEHGVFRRLRNDEIAMTLCIVPKEHSFA